jgi:hypothetical protein
MADCQEEERRGQSAKKGREFQGREWITWRVDD